MLCVYRIGLAACLYLLCALPLPGTLTVLLFNMIITLWAAARAIPGAKGFTFGLLTFALAWGLRDKRELILVILVNCLTNPPVVLLYHTAAGLWRWLSLPVTTVLECAAVLTNIFSYGMGCLINLLF